jgi:hypothetical protein
VHVIALQPEAELLEIVAALRPPRGFAGGLHRRQEQRHQEGDDRDHHEHLDEREARPLSVLRVRSPTGHRVASPPA